MNCFRFAKNLYTAVLSKTKLKSIGCLSPFSEVKARIVLKKDFSSNLMAIIASLTTN